MALMSCRSRRSAQPTPSLCSSHSAVDGPTAVLEAPRTGGLPLAAVELAAVLRTDQSPTQLSTLPAYYRSLVEALPVSTRAALLLVALGTDAATAERALGPSARDALADAELREIVTVDGRRVNFRHPALRAAVADQADRTTIREAHRLIADALDPETEGDDRTRHLALAIDPPNDNIAAALEAMALRAIRRGANAEAAEAFHGAALFASAAEERNRLLLSGGDARHFIGEIDQAIAIASRVGATTSSPELRDRALRLRSFAGMWHANPGRLYDELVATATLDPTQRASVEAVLGSFAFLAGRMHDAVDRLGSSEASAIERGEDPGADPVRNALLAWNLFLLGQ